MNKLVFLNLAIDQLWDPTKNLASVFPARIPESEHLIRVNENLGLFLADENDLVLGYKETPGYREFLTKRNLSLAPMITVKSHPFDQEQWLQEVFEKIEHRGPFSSILSASISALEMALLSRVDIANPSASPLNSDKWAELNRKTFLLDLAKQGLVTIPETEILWQQDLVASKVPVFSDKRILKHDFGSGGAANFSVLGSKDPNFHLLQRRLDPKIQVQWLLQKQIASNIEGSVFGWSKDPADSQAALIQYSQQGLSYRHDFDVESDLLLKAQTIYEKIKDHLSRFNYSGPIGLDFLYQADTDQIVVVDLNLRLTKTHVISSAIQKLGLTPKTTISLRHRWKSQDPLTFQRWWQQCRADFQLAENGETTDGNFIIPYSVAGIESVGGLKEVSVFISRTPSFENAVRTKWGIA